MLEIIGATAYLLNKFFFLMAVLSWMISDKEAERWWRMRAWEVYMIGLPFVTILLWSSDDWIFGWLELGGFPQMLLAWYRARRNIKTKPARWVNFIVYAAILIGLTISWRVLGGIHTVAQFLEIVAAGTFLFGNWLLLRENPAGFLWYLAMFAATGPLLFSQDYFWFGMQQIASAAVIWSAYKVSISRQMIIGNENYFWLIELMKAVNSHFVIREPVH